MRWLDGIPDSVDMSLSRPLGDREAWCAAVRGASVRWDLATQQQHRVCGPRRGCPSLGFSVQTCRAPVCTRGWYPLAAAIHSLVCP